MKTILCLALIFSACLCGFAQEKLLSQAEFDNLSKHIYSHTEKWKEKAYRMTFISKSTVSESPNTDYATKKISEFLPAGNTRTISETTLGGKMSKSEMIRIGDKLYTRSGDEDWKVGQSIVKPEDASEKKSGMPDETRVKTGETVEIRALGSEIFNNQKVEVFEQITRLKAIDLKTGLERDSVHKTKYLIGPDGLLLKMEYAGETKTGEKIYQTQMSMVWELTPELSIEAPKVK